MKRKNDFSLLKEVLNRHGFKKKRDMSPLFIYEKKNNGVYFYLHIDFETLVSSIYTSLDLSPLSKVFARLNPKNESELDIILAATPYG